MGKERRECVVKVTSTKSDQLTVRQKPERQKKLNANAIFSAVLIWQFRGE